MPIFLMFIIIVKKKKKTIAVMAKRKVMIFNLNSFQNLT